MLTTTLSEEIKLQDIQSIDLLKIDVEGYYMEVLGGLDDAGFARVRNAVVEIEYADVTGAGPDEVERYSGTRASKPIHVNRRYTPGASEIRSRQR